MSIAACGTSNSNQQKKYNNQLFISVPSSMYSAMKLIKDIYQSDNPNIDVYTIVDLLALYNNK